MSCLEAQKLLIVFLTFLAFYLYVTLHVRPVGERMGGPCRNSNGEETNIDYYRSGGNRSNEATSENGYF